MGVEWGYSTSIKDNKYQIQGIVVSDKVRSVKFIVDTGAEYTCCHYTSVNLSICEENLITAETKLFGGFVKSLPVKFYKLRLQQFTIGNIDMGSQEIWVTFDERVTDTVLGVDILQQVIFMANPYNIVCTNFDWQFYARRVIIFLSGICTEAKEAYNGSHQQGAQGSSVLFFVREQRT